MNHSKHIIKYACNFNFAHTLFSLFYYMCHSFTLLLSHFIQLINLSFIYRLSMCIEQHPFHQVKAVWIILQTSINCMNCNFRCQLYRKTVHTCRYRWKYDCSDSILHCQLHRIKITVSKKFFLFIPATIPYWSNSMNYIITWQIIFFLFFRFAKIQFPPQEPFHALQSFLVPHHPQ